MTLSVVCNPLFSYYVLCVNQEYVLSSIILMIYILIISVDHGGASVSLGKVLFMCNIHLLKILYVLTEHYNFIYLISLMMEY